MPRVPMHILIIPSERYVPPASPLEGIFQRHQAHALARAGFKVGILSPFGLRSLRLLRNGFGKYPSGVDVGEDHGIPVFKYQGWNWLPGVRGGHRELALRAGAALFGQYAATHGSPDVIHAHNAHLAGMLASRIKKTYKVPYVLTEHSSAYARGQAPPGDMSYIREAFRNAGRRIVVSPQLGRVLEDVVGDSVLPWHWVPNILEADFEQPVEVVANQFRERPFRFLNVGALIEVKAQDDLLTAFAQKFGGNREVELRIVGAGPLKEKLETLAEVLHIAPQLTFLGELSHHAVRAEMRACDVYVHSSYYETFGVVLIEALACGKPIVATASGGPDCIVTRDNGLLARTRDVASLGGAMIDLRENIGHYSAERIRQDCISRFGSEAIVSQLTNIYAAVI
jgi:glycosyltransferase involved in cell wall biosynthesis